MAVKGKKVEYDLDETTDIFVAPTWPSAFLQDPAYALFRPLYERTSPWRTSYSALYQYLSSQARRLGGRRHVLFYLSNLAKVAGEYPHLHAFLLAPFESTNNLTQVFLELEFFLRWRFEKFSEDPWLDFPAPEPVAPKGHISEKDIEAIPIVLSEQDRKKLLKKVLAKIPWQEQLQRALENESGIAGFHTTLIENAIKECPDLLTQRANEDLVNQIFASPVQSLTLTLGVNDYLVAEIPVMLGSHYLGKRTQKVWFDRRGKKFYRILGCYARWDDAKIVLFKHSIHADSGLQKRMFAEIRERQSLISVGNWKKAQVDGVDYYLALLIDSDLPDRSFFVSEWEVNCPQLSIVLEKDTTNGDA